MKIIKRAALIFVLLNKRLFKKYIFVILLAMVLLFAAGMKLISKEDSGILTIALCIGSDENESASAEDISAADTASESQEIINKLTSSDSVIKYIQVPDEESAKNMVSRGSADAAWILPADLETRIAEFVNKHSRSFVTVYVNKDNVQTRLVREQFVGAIYGELSRSITYEFVRANDAFADMDDEELRKKINECYDNDLYSESLFTFAYLDDTDWDSDDTSDYLAAPVRGIMAILILLGSLALSMFYIQDENDRIFAAMPLGKNILFPFFYVLIGTLDIAIIALAGLYISGTFTSFGREIGLAALYVPGVSAFSSIIRICCKTAKRLGCAIPVLILVSLVLCPVFISLKILPVLQHILPPYYYLNSLYSPIMLTRMLIYTAAVIVICLILEKLKSLRLSR